MQKENQKTPILCVPESNDPMVARAIEKLQHEGNVNILDAAQINEEFALAESLSSLETDHRKTSYEKAIRLVGNAGVSGIIAGATIDKATYLKLLLRHRKTDLTGSLFSLAPIEIVGSKGKTLFIVDPAVRVNPSSHTLAEVIIKASQMVADLIKREPIVGVISHTTGHSQYTKKQTQTLRILANYGVKNVIPYPVQIDAALRKTFREKKEETGYSNADLLVFPDLTSANVFYKTLSIFAQNTTKLGGGLLGGIENGVYGLLSRSSEPEEFLRLYRYMIMLAENRQTNSHE